MEFVSSNACKARSARFDSRSPLPLTSRKVFSARKHAAVSCMLHAFRCSRTRLSMMSLFLHLRSNFPTVNKPNADKRNRRKKFKKKRFFWHFLSFVFFKNTERTERILIWTKRVVEMLAQSRAFIEASKSFPGVVVVENKRQHPQLRTSVTSRIDVAKVERR